MKYNSFYKQRGISAKILIFVLIVVGFVGFIGLKLFPIFSENGQVMKSIEQVKNMPESKNFSPSKIKGAILKKFYQNDIREIGAANFKEHITIKKTSEGYQIIVLYSREFLVAKNIFVTVKFDSTTDIL
ncbi:MAG: DUF4845 domain-containing protein [Gammaproteobacteria bacterium]|nr:DUF4845 domain-containing protein [Gammaproteobacteria bacterium]